MKKRSMKITLVVFVLFLMILACGGDRNLNENETLEINNSKNLNIDEPTEEIAAPIDTITTSISNPAPQGTPVVIEGISYVISSSLRPASEIVIAGDPNNNKPFNSEEYIFVELEATCQKPSNESCDFGLKYISLLGSYGETRLREIFINGVDGLMLSAEIKGGESISGNLPFIIPADETDLMLVINSTFGDSSYLGIN